MKKYVLSIIVVLAALFLAVQWAEAAGGEWTYSSTQTADAQITASGALYYGIMVEPDGTNAVDVTVYKNSAASGTKAMPTITVAGDGGTIYAPLNEPTGCYDGIYVDVTISGGGSVEYTVYYRPWR